MNNGKYFKLQSTKTIRNQRDLQNFLYICMKFHAFKNVSA